MHIGSLVRHDARKTASLGHQMEFTRYFAACGEEQGKQDSSEACSQRGDYRDYDGLAFYAAFVLLIRTAFQSEAIRVVSLDGALVVGFGIQDDGYRRRNERMETFPGAKGVAGDIVASCQRFVRGT